MLPFPLSEFGWRDDSFAVEICILCVGRFLFPLSIVWRGGPGGEVCALPTTLLQSVVSLRPEG
jgi:hypothetical protein